MSYHAGMTQRPTFLEQLLRIQPIGILLGLPVLFLPDGGLIGFLFVWLVFFLPCSALYTALMMPVRDFGDDLRNRGRR
jgi:hypothetical protein